MHWNREGNRPDDPLGTARRRPRTALPAAVVSASVWSYAVEPPDDGWIWLPRPDEGTDPAAWAEEVCGDLHVPRRKRAPLALQLRAYVLSSRRRAGDMAAI